MFAARFSKNIVHTFYYLLRCLPDEKVSEFALFDAHSEHMNWSIANPLYETLTLLPLFGLNFCSALLFIGLLVLLLFSSVYRQKSSVF